MGHIPLLDELAIVAALAVVVTVALARLKLPTVAGLLAAGALLGPHGLGLATSVKSIDVLAEVGVVLLLFSIGMEFSLARLRSIFRQVALGGALQVVLTTGAATAIAAALGEPTGRAVLYGFAFALSSTAVVLRALTERRELDAPHGRFIVGTLIFQDLCVVPMVLIVPVLGTSGTVSTVALDLALAMGKAIAMVAIIVLVARYLVPRALAQVAASRSREVFLLAVLGLCIGTAWLTSLAGLSLALGAFLGGMVIADTEYGHRAIGDTLPLRDTFVSIFFISLGMLFEVRIVLEQPLLVGALLTGFLLGKGALATFAALAMRFPARVAWLAGLGLAQFGEFGFVLMRLAQSHGLIDAEGAAPLLAAGILSMFLTPLLVRIAPHITAGERLLAPLERLLGVRSIDQADEGGAGLRGHVVVVGLGLGGRVTARALADSGVPLVVLELDTDLVAEGRALGLPVYYADATSAEALEHAHLSSARMLVLLINDPQAAQRVVSTAKRVAPTVPVLMRTRYLRERQAMLSLGASDVVAEEVEGAVEVLWRLLRALEIPRNLIDDKISAARADTLATDRKQTVPRSRLDQISGIGTLKIESARIGEGSQAAGSSTSELRLRSTTGALVVAVSRNGTLLEHPDPHQPFAAGDVVYFVGTREAIERALPIFDGPLSVSQLG